MPKTVNWDQRRAEFTSASSDVIAEKGLRATTLRVVAATAGCTTGALTHYFPDRRSLLIATLRAVQSEAGERMRKAAANASTDYERLRVVVLESLPLDRVRLREWRVWLAFWGESVNDEALGVENARRYAEWRRILWTLLEPLCGVEPSAEYEVAHLMALTDGIGLALALGHSGGSESDSLVADSEAVVIRHLSRFDRPASCAP